MENQREKTPKRGKRFLHEDSDSEEESRNIALDAGLDGAWPRFLLVKGAEEERPLSGLSPFAINKWFQGISTVGFKDIKKLRGGDFLVECSTRRASDLLLKRNGANCVDRKITVELHHQLNSSRGVIRCPDLKGLPDQEIRQELTSQGVTQVQRVLVTKEGRKVPTNTLFLTFAMAKLPESIKVGYLRVKVTPFVPSPLRCFKCQKFGHGSKNCAAKEVCRDCGKDKHDGGCKDPKYCVNCEGQHSSSSRDCPKWKLEQEIQRVRASERCSFADARKKVTSSKVQSQSYASAAASSVMPPAAPGATQLEALILKLTERIINLEAAILALAQGRQIQITPASQPSPTSSAPSSSKPRSPPKPAHNPPPPQSPPPHQGKQQTASGTAPGKATTASASAGAKKAAALRTPSGSRDGASNNKEASSLKVAANTINNVVNSKNVHNSRSPHRRASSQDSANRYEILAGMDVDPPS
jgi:hypothetical protein